MFSTVRSSSSPREYEKQQFDALLAEFDVPRDKLESMIADMNKEFDQGLSKDGQHKASCKMLPTYVHEIPDGTENGNFFALDLGGTNFRVLLVQINNGKVSQQFDKFPISEELMTSSGDALFDYIAACLSLFAKQHLGEDFKHIEAVGFTFSFPVEQTSLTSGTLLKWTKGFDIEEVVGTDVIQWLHKAIQKRQELTVDKIYLVNDTTGVLMAGALHDQQVAIGLILGTGTNACFLEHLTSMEKIEDRTHENMIVNIEWGAFAGSSLVNDIRTEYDRLLDDQSLHPHHQLFEKMISGMYLGEIVRLCLLKLIKKHIIFRGILTPEIEQKDAFTTEFVSRFCRGSMRDSLEILSSLGYGEATIEEAMTVQQLCEAVSRRAAVLASTGLASIIRRLQRSEVTVAVDGSLFKHHPTFKGHMYNTLQLLLPPTVAFKLRLSEDGSGAGAAIIAAVVNRLQKTNK